MASGALNARSTPGPYATVVFGHQPFATWAVQQLRSISSYDVIGVVAEKTDRDHTHHGLDLPPLHDYARVQGIPILAANELPSYAAQTGPIFGLVARYGRIIPEDTITACALGLLNCHGGYLPRWRGMNIPNHVILEGAEYSGATLHYIDTGVDTGPILDRQTFPVAATATALDVYLSTQATLMTLLERNLTRLVTGRTEALPQEALIAAGEPARTYRVRDLESARETSFERTADELDRIARAFEFPGRERAYVQTGERRVYLTPRPWDGAAAP